MSKYGNENAAAGGRGRSTADRDRMYGGGGGFGGGESAIKADVGTIRLVTLPEFSSPSLNYRKVNNGKIFVPTVTQVP